MLIEHQFGPVFDSRSEILILGSFPSVRSRAQGFYYGHPQNRFWPLMARLFGDDPGRTPESRRAFALRNRIALWDVAERCEIRGSSDSSIRDVTPTDLSRILDACRIRRVFLNGGTAFWLFEKYQMGPAVPPAVRLPSTSPANAAWSLDRLLEAWQVIRMPDA
ncbi:MAG: DNA-deoxyinosine glycosylase [Clostridia bacterium]|nr:DNA-deoxyinosine glycosylase [Clostridia bacterium]